MAELIGMEDQVEDVVDLARTLRNMVHKNCEPGDKVIADNLVNDIKTAVTEIYTDAVAEMQRIEDEEKDQIINNSSEELNEDISG